MASPRKAAPDGLSGKRPALAVAAKEVEEMSAAERLQAEVESEDEAVEDGSVVVTLETDRGFADITVPPMGRWRSMARAALFSRGDDLTWAALTLSPTDAQTWSKLDPTKDDADGFFARWGESTGENLAKQQGQNRASRRTRMR